MKIYEKCLIPCANYPEFWMRYVEFMETKGGRELSNFALERATQIFVEVCHPIIVALMLTELSHISYKVLFFFFYNMIFFRYK